MGARKCKKRNYAHLIPWVYISRIVAAATLAKDDFKSTAIFSAIEEALKADGPALVSKVRYMSGWSCTTMPISATCCVMSK